MFCYNNLYKPKQTGNLYFYGDLEALTDLEIDGKTIKPSEGDIFEDDDDWMSVEDFIHVYKEAGLL